MSPTFSREGESPSLQAHRGVNQTELWLLLERQQGATLINYHPFSVKQEALFTRWPLLHFEPSTALDRIESDGVQPKRGAERGERGVWEGERGGNEPKTGFRVRFCGRE